MQMLYHSDSWVVVRLQADAAAGSATGLEIVDKKGRRDFFLQGALAERFERGVEALVRDNAGAAPSEEQFDDYIAGFATLPPQPLVLH